MHILLFLLPAVLGLFLWMYLVTYLMYLGVGNDFLQRARWGVLRGIIVATIFVGIQMSPWSSIIGRDWILFPLIFLCVSLPFSWRNMLGSITIPLILGLMMWSMTLFFDLSHVWSPFHEEIGKWYQSVTASYPAVMSPFVSLGFGFLENARYFSVHLSWGQIIGRTLFSLPLHLFATFFGFWCIQSLRPRWFGVFIGLLGAISLHALYNWTLNFSILSTLSLILFGYAFYGWSMNQSWWKKNVR